MPLLDQIDGFQTSDLLCDPLGFRGYVHLFDHCIYSDILNLVHFGASLSGHAVQLEGVDVRVEHRLQVVHVSAFTFWVLDFPEFVHVLHREESFTTPERCHVLDMVCPRTCHVLERVSTSRRHVLDMACTTTRAREEDAIQLEGVDARVEHRFQVVHVSAFVFWLSLCLFWTKSMASRPRSCLVALGLRVIKKKSSRIYVRVLDCLRILVYLVIYDPG